VADDRKHILYLSSWYPSKNNPFLGNFVKRQVELLATVYHVTVIHTVSTSDVNNIELEEFKQDHLKEYIIYHPPGKTLFQKRKIQRAALDLGLEKVSYVDLLMTQILLPKGWQFMKVKKNFNCPWIHIEQGSYFRPETRANWSIIEKTIVKRCSKHITSLFAVSEFLKKDLKVVFPNRRIGVIPNHVDTDLFSQKKQENGNDHTRFIHVSTLDVKTKNPAGIFEACKIVKNRKGKAFKLIVISDEPAQVWKKHCSEEGLEDIIHFEGAKEWEDLPSYYQNSDAFILNSDYETFSIVLAEAWCTGIATLTTPVGIGENLPKHLGLQSKIKDASSLANRMIEFMENKDQFNSEEIRNQAMKYSSSNVLEELKAIIDTHVG